MVRKGGKLTSIRIKLPADLVRIIDENLRQLGYASRAEYLRDVIRRDLVRRGLLVKKAVIDS